MKSYLDIVEKVLTTGVIKHNRTGVDAITVPGIMFEHDMKDGFPLLTTKSVPFRLISSELEFFIKGITDKKWLQDRNNHIWDEWCSPECVPYGNDEETKAKMRNERNLGPVYGFSWRNFGGQYIFDKTTFYQKYFSLSFYLYKFYKHIVGIDQLKNLVEKLNTNPDDRRMIVSAWNPMELHRMALPPCHYCFQVTVINNHLNLLWNQRSVDVGLGLPFNISSYALLLHLLALQSGLEEGKLVGFLADTHIYANHVDGIKEQLNRELYPLPKIVTKNFKDIFSWEYTDSTIENYKHHPKIVFEVAV
jgi:thymidylate synthase